MQLIGLTGGIASGKSTVARRLAEHGAVIIDADQLARDVVAPGTAGLARIVAEFGPDVLTADRALNRSVLGQRVFADEGARATLEAIIHPAIHDEFQRRLDSVRSQDPNAVVVYDVPLLVETKREFPFDLVVTTRAGQELQLERLLNERGYDLAEAHARIAAQASDEQRIARADVVIDTSGTMAETMAAVDALWLDRLSNLD